MTDCCKSRARVAGSEVLRMLLSAVGSILLMSVLRRLERSSCEGGSG